MDSLQGSVKEGDDPRVKSNSQFPVAQLGEDDTVHRRSGRMVPKQLTTAILEDKDTMRRGPSCDLRVGSGNGDVCDDDPFVCFFLGCDCALDLANERSFLLLEVPDHESGSVGSIRDEGV